MPLWSNPEFVRHVRAELRPPRALTAGLLALVICVLVGLLCWTAERDNPRKFFALFHSWLVGIQYVVAGFWCASACGQAISRERELKTYDFLKTTRLTAAELFVGKLLGAPILAYFTVICSLPVSLLSGIFAGVSPVALFWTYVLLAAVGLFLGTFGLLGSMLVEKSSAVIGLLGLLPVSLGFSFAFTPFPGFGAISAIPAVLSLYAASADVARVTPTLFGIPVSFVFLTLLLYAAFGAWFVLMLTRNLKKDREEIRLLSRWQAIGFAAFLNVLFYALLDPKQVSSQSHSAALSPKDVSSLAVGLNVSILFLVGLVTLTPHERLKMWWRRRAAGEEPYLSSDGLPWPWMALAAVIAYTMLVVEAAALRAIPFAEWQLGTAAIQLAAFLVFATRDILFLQWCTLTRMKRPVVKGFLYLCLYYTAAGIILMVVSLVSPSRGLFVSGLLAPYVVFNPTGIRPSVTPGLYAGMALQIGIIFFLLNAISARLRRPALVPAVSAS